MNNRFYQGYFARKRFRQNFLIDQFVIDNIVFAIHPQPSETIIEIVPGLGALTEPVGAHIDCMTVNFADMAKQAGQPLHVFGNLPYNISILLMFHLFIYI